MFCFFEVEFFLLTSSKTQLDFAVACFVSGCARSRMNSALQCVCEPFFPRALLLRPCVTGASFTGSATAIELPGFTAFDDK